MSTMICTTTLTLRRLDEGTSEIDERYEAAEKKAWWRNKKRLDEGTSEIDKRYEAAERTKDERAATMKRRWVENYLHWRKTDCENFSSMISTVKIK